MYSMVGLVAWCVLALPLAVAVGRMLRGPADESAADSSPMARWSADPDPGRVASTTSRRTGDLRPLPDRPPYWYRVPLVP
jgi:hypothetical protein